MGNMLATRYESLSSSIGLKNAERIPNQARNRGACADPTLSFLTLLPEPSGRCVQSCSGYFFGLWEAPKL